MKKGTYQVEKILLEKSTRNGVLLLHRSASVVRPMLNTLTELSNKLQPASGNKRKVASFSQHSTCTMFQERGWSRSIRDGGLLTLAKLQQERVSPSRPESRLPLA